MEFDKIEPIGVEAHFLGHAITASTLANINRDSKKQKQPFTPADFIPEFIKPPARQLTPKERSKQLAAFFISKGK